MQMGHPASFWKLSPHQVWWSVLGLAALFAAMRIVGTLGPNNLRWVLPLGFVAMALTPWLLMHRAGREHMGLYKRGRWAHMGLGAVAGVLAALFCYGLGLALFGTSPDHWFVSVASNFRQSVPAAKLSFWQLYWMMTIPSLIFSPIGEEIFFRGVLQQGLQERLSERASTLAECALFGLVHLCHHGLVLSSAGLSVRPLSGALWVLLMFGAAYLFATVKKRSGALLPAMVSHAAFNLCMTSLIFAFVWRAF